MKIQEALRVIKLIAESVRGTKKEHAYIAEAIKTLEKAATKKSVDKNK